MVRGGAAAAAGLLVDKLGPGIAPFAKIVLGGGTVGLNQHQNHGIEIAINMLTMEVMGVTRQ